MKVKDFEFLGECRDQVKMAGENRVTSNITGLCYGIMEEVVDKEEKGRGGIRGCD